MRRQGLAEPRGVNAPVEVKTAEDEDGIAALAHPAPSSAMIGIIRPMIFTAGGYLH